ncbi:MAG: OsmC family protein [Candidatus Brocadiia bacterium]
MKTTVTCTNLENLQVQLRTDAHSWVADEPPRLGGDGLGPNPFDLLLASLAACTTLTVYHHAAEKGIPAEKIWVDAAGEWKKDDDDGETYHIAITLRVRGELEGEQLGELEAIAQRCPVKKLLDPAAHITTEVEAV